MTPVERAARIAQLQAKLAARRGKTGFDQNVRELEAEIDRLRGEADAVD